MVGAVVVASCAPKALFLPKSTNIGAATKMEEYVPVITPINIAKANPLVTSPPKMKRMRSVKNTVNDVITVRLSVSFIALLIILVLSDPFISFESSRIRS